MVLISLIHRVNTIKHHIHPFRTVTWYDFAEVPGLFCTDVPASVALHVTLCDHIDTVFITQFIDADCIRIMTGTDGIDIVLFHDHQVFDQFFSGYHATGYRTEFVTVYTFEDDSLAVQHHDGIFHLKTTEAHSLRDHFCYLSVLIHYFQ